MLKRVNHAQSPTDFLVEHQPDIPVHFFCPVRLEAQAAAFRSGFDGMVTYAVKANPQEQVIRTLCKAGIGGFDVASPDEISAISDICPKAAMHYHNPVRSRSEIALGIKAGVSSWSVDCESELTKLMSVLPEKAEIAVRLRLDVGGAAYNFGSKFGAEPAEVGRLLQAVAAAGHLPSITFHVGTQCLDPMAFASYIRAAAMISRTAQVPLYRLNIGGGFPSARDQAVELTPFFQAVEDAMTAFETRPRLVCEPGRGLVADSFSYAVRIKAIRDGALFLNDGVYGGLSEFVSMCPPKVQVIGPDGTLRTGSAIDWVAFGPTCDSLDRLREPLSLPSSLEEGDWLLFKSMGAYLTGVTTRFNGYGDCMTVTVDDL